MTASTQHAKDRNSRIFDNFITETELAEEFGVTERYIQSLRTEKNLPYLRVGKAVWYDIESVRLWFKSQLKTEGEPKNVYTKKI